MGFLKRLLTALSNKKYRKNTESGELLPEDYIAINIGAINAEQTSCFCNSLETGVDKKITKGNLRNYYEIFDHDSAIETLTWLKERGHRFYFDAIASFCAEKVSQIDESILEDSEKANTYGYINNLKSALPSLIKNDFLKTKEEIENHSILAWDMGRLVLVTRCCVDASYISKDEGWEFIRDAYKECKKVYKNWEELANEYVIGRAMFGGEGFMLNGIMEITKNLIEDKESPWKKYPLK